MILSNTLIRKNIIMLTFIWSRFVEEYKDNYLSVWNLEEYSVVGLNNIEKHVFLYILMSNSKSPKKDNSPPEDYDP